MKNSKKWLMAIGVSAIFAVNGILAFAAAPDQQGENNGRPPCAVGKFDPGMNSFREHHAKLLALLKIDDSTFRADIHAGKTLLTIAKEHGVSEQELKDFMIKEMTQRIDDGLKAGRISAEQAEQMKSDMDKRVTDMINGKGSMHRGLGPMPGHGLFDNQGLLSLLKVNADQLRSAMCSGKTLVAVANENGVSEDQLKDFLVKDITEHIDADVKAGRLSADRADKMKANLEAHVTDMINGKAPMHRGHGPMPRPDEQEQTGQNG